MELNGAAILALGAATAVTVFLARRDARRARIEKLAELEQSPSSVRELFVPAAANDKRARAKYEHLKMSNGSYPFGEVPLTLCDVESQGGC